MFWEIKSGLIATGALPALFIINWFINKLWLPSCILISSVNWEIQIFLHPTFSFSISFSHNKQVSLRSPAWSPRIFKLPIVLLRIFSIPNHQHPRVRISFTTSNKWRFIDSSWVSFQFGSINRNCQWLMVHSSFYCCLTFRGYGNTSQNLPIFFAEIIWALLIRSFVRIWRFKSDPTSFNIFIRI